MLVKLYKNKLLSEDILSSFSSAGNLYPIKLILNETVLNMIKSKNLSPVSISLNPTNKCNLKCDFCSCADREKNISLDINEIKNFIKSINTIQSVIITGGGEPLLYNDFEELINYLFELNISIGLVTNGLLLQKHKTEILEKIKWIRISLSEISASNECFSIIKKVIKSTKKTKWSFSYVCGKNNELNYKTVKDFYYFFFKKINHMRIVNDLINLDDRVDILENTIKQDSFIDCSKMIFQNRKEYTKGSKKCYIAMLKPNITAEGIIAPCCGTQYAINKIKNKREYNKNLSLGNIKNTNKSFESNYFNGNLCEVCYYKSYNDLINMLFNNVSDIEFI